MADVYRDLVSSAVQGVLRLAAASSILEVLQAGGLGAEELLNLERYGLELTAKACKTCNTLKSLRVTCNNPKPLMPHPTLSPPRIIMHLEPCFVERACPERPQPVWVQSHCRRVCSCVHVVQS